MMNYNFDELCWDWRLARMACCSHLTWAALPTNVAPVVAIFYRRDTLQILRSSKTFQFTIFSTLEVYRPYLQ
jgi:hypothetical protein